MDDIEKIEYQPKSVREILVEMKDLSELMIDLAYSSALLNDDDLANEVLRLEREVDNLAYHLKIHAMIAARNIEEAEQLSGVLMVASATDMISDAAADIATIVLRDIRIHPIVREAFERVEEQLCCIKVAPSSVMVGKNLGELDLEPRLGINVIAIQRSNRWIINPEAREIIKEDDLIICRGTSKGLNEFRDLATGSAKKLECRGHGIL
ncbi:MAG: TrkA C-terminal domain-containing protein [Nitrososphaerota archaeon]|nr:TrkA C-terminal domain-containing protein [Nitrososphaerota archaeon]